MRNEHEHTHTRAQGDGKSLTPSIGVRSLGEGCTIFYASAYAKCYFSFSLSVSLSFSPSLCVSFPPLVTHDIISGNFQCIFHFDFADFRFYSFPLCFFPSFFFLFFFADIFVTIFSFLPPKRGVATAVTNFYTALLSSLRRSLIIIFICCCD